MEPRYDTLFYDGQCPLCAKEIRTLRKLQRGNLIFADIHEQHDGSSNLPGHEALLKRLHLMTWTGEWVIGLPANVRAWSHALRFSVQAPAVAWNLSDRLAYLREMGRQAV